MASKLMMGGGALFLAAAIAATQYLKLQGELNYLWAGLALVWGLIVLMDKKR